MTLSRRKFITVIGGGVVLAATAAGAGFLATRRSDVALAPWQQAGSYDEPRRRALSYAILAPNSHNLQSWSVDLSTPGQLTLYADLERLLPQTDPFGRQITIGLGCFLEVLRMAAAQDGYRLDIEPFPAGSDAGRLDQRPVAHIEFVADQNVAKDPLFVHVLQRRSLKTPYDLERDVPASVLAALREAGQNAVEIGATNAGDRVKALRALTHQGLKIEIETPRTYRESVEVFRIGKAEINENPDGIALGGAMIESLAAVGMFSRELALDPGSSAYQQGIAVEMAKVDTAMGYVWLITEGNSRAEQLQAGYDWVRVNLAATGLGVGLHPLSQVLQEFEEMRGLYQEIHKQLDAGGRRVQMLGRLGYGAAMEPSPRWPIEAKIRAS